jgi:ribosomal protein S18
MASRRLVSSTGLVSRLSKLSVASSKQQQYCGPSLQSFRLFTTDGKDGEDPFGVKFEDGAGNLGKDLPPNYIRDKATGKFTGEVIREISGDDEKLLKMDDAGKERLLVDRLTAKWHDDEEGDEAFHLAQQISEEEMALNTLGRSPKGEDIRGLRKDGEEDAFDDETGFSQPLTPEEFKSFARYMKKEHDTQISDSDIPVLNPKSKKDAIVYEDNPDLDLRWMSTASQREMDGFDVVDPLADLMPHDMNPTRKVNRKKAKSIPKELLHHNNLGLLRRYVTPAGQIMNRSKSRLGAKDQRKIAKLIKRARALGLIPNTGQWKYENHGNMYEDDIDQEREWEEELVRRGLTTRDHPNSS